MTYNASGLPAGLTINSSNGLISGTPNSVGNNTVFVTVSDATKNASAQFNWSITEPIGVFSNQVSNTAISVNGSVTDWSGLDYYANDPDDTSGTNNQIDWLRASVAHSTQNVFISYQNRQNIDSSNSSGTYVP